MSLLPCITWRISTSFFSTRIDDHLLAYRKTTQTWTQILVPSATGVRMPGKHEKTLSNRINESVRNLDAAAFSRGVVPDIVKFGSGLGCNAMRHQREEVCSEATGATTLFHFFGQLSHGFLSDIMPLAVCEGSLCSIDGRENFRAGALTLFPERQSLLDSLVFAVQSSALNCLADEGFLIGREMYFHRFKGRRARGRVSTGLRGRGAARHWATFDILKTYADTEGHCCYRQGNEHHLYGDVPADDCGELS